MQDKKLAVIFGVTGQDGSYLSELLLEKGHYVVGVSRRTSTNNLDRIEHLLDTTGFELVEGDLSDYSSVHRILSKFMPHQVYNLAAQSHVGTSFDEPLHTMHVNVDGCLNILEVIRQDDYLRKHCHFYQASSSEMFGNSVREANFNITDDFRHQAYQDENTLFDPASPYAVAKLASHNLVKCYRESYGMFCVAGILFNHESPRRGEKFLTKKVAMFVASLYRWANVNGYTDEDDVDYVEDLHNKPGCPKLHLGNLDAKRDWGHAKDYVEAMRLMLEQDSPKDYVIATGKSYSVKDFVIMCFEEIGIGNWEDFVVIDEDFMRPNEVKYLCGNATRAKRELHWSPRYNILRLVADMVHYEINAQTPHDDKREKEVAKNPN